MIASINGSLDSMERGTVEWNGGTEEYWNERLTTLYRFYSHKWANWACALAEAYEATCYWRTIDISTSWKSVLKLYKKKPVHVLLCCIKLRCDWLLSSGSLGASPLIRGWHPDYSSGVVTKPYQPLTHTWKLVIASYWSNDWLIGHRWTLAEGKRKRTTFREIEVCNTVEN